MRRNIHISARNSLRPLAICLAGASIFLGSFETHATFITQTWDGSDSGAYNLGANWVSGTAPGSADYAVFDSTTLNQTVTFATNQSPYQIRFITGAGAYSFNGPGELRLSAVPDAISNTSTSGSATFNNAIRLNNGGTTGILSAGETDAFVKIAGIVSGSVANPMVLDLLGKSTNILNEVSGNISNGTSPSLGLSKSNGGTWTVSGTNSYTGTTTVNGGNLLAGSTQAFGTSSAVTMANAATTNLNLNGFNNSIGSLAGGGASGGNVILGTATLTTGGNNTSTSYAGLISGTGGSLIKVGSGTQTLTGANSYTGGTTVSNGTLLVNNTVSSGTGTGAVAVNNSGTLLGGTGTITGSVSVGATGTPGAAITAATRGTSGTVVAGNVGTLKTGALTLASGSIFHFDVFNTGGTAGTSYDQVAVTGTVTLGNATLEGSILSGLSFTAGQTLTLINNDTATDAFSGTFNGIAQGSTLTFDGYSFTASYTGGDGNDFVLTVAPVPEPSTWLGGALIAALAGWSQRKRIGFLSVL